MESEPSTRQGYLINEREGGNDFSFITVHGIEYLVYFTEADGYVPSASFASNTKMVGFTPIKDTVEAGKRLPNDPHVWTAIFEVIYLYMNRHPNMILLYVCSDESVWNPGPAHRHARYARKRSDVFAERYAEWQQTGVVPAEKIDYGLYGQLYCSCMFRSGNPHETEIRWVKEQTILEKQ